MRCSSLFSAGLLVGTTLAQANLTEILLQFPACSAKCSAEILPLVGCQFTDLRECLCPNFTLRYDLAICVLGSCNLTDQVVASTILQSEICDGVPQPSRAAEMIRASIIIALVTFPIILLRFLSQIVVTRKVWWDDWLILLTVLFYISQIFYVLQNIPKFSILFFYLRIFPSPRFRLFNIAIFWMAVHITTFLLSVMFQCLPVGSIWNLALSSKCLDLHILGFVGEGFSITEDLAIMALLIYELKNLNLDKRKRIELCFMFAVGSFACATSMIRLRYLIHYGKSIDTTWNGADITIWSEIETYSAVICSCLMCLRPLLKILPRLFPSTTHSHSRSNPNSHFSKPLFAFCTLIPHGVNNAFGGNANLRLPVNFLPSTGNDFLRKRRPISMNSILERASPALPYILITSLAFISISIVIHIVKQIVFSNKDEPPLVFSWLPLIGSTIEYGTHPYKFYFKYQKKFGNTFSFILVGRKHTFMKYSLTPDKLQSYAPLFFNEMGRYIDKADCFRGDKGIFDVVESVAIMTLFTAARSLQGREVRESLNGELANLYHDLDMSFIPINFYLPGLPLPVNRRRDRAREKIVAIYKNIIANRRRLGERGAREEDDMIWNLMRSIYKNGTPVPDHEIAHMMIGLLMAGQHNSYSVESWILFRLASRPDIQEELYQEQLKVLGSEIKLSATRGAVDRLPLHKMVVRETLRLHEPIHTVMRAVKSPLHFTTKDPLTASDRTYTIPPSHVLISAPGVTAQSKEFFPNPDQWDPHRWDGISDFGEDTGKNPPGNVALSRSAASAYLPFGAGRHRCVGETFAYLQLSTITAFMVRNFKFRSLPGHEAIPETDYKSMITRPVVPAKLLWERRSVQ
ncbi:hypothetical protein G7Y89_g8639 [Cudoniella acicularis]|uniref:CFEM domain-containing protein n=1 Tax=Cudoniella acicularis TaxID=354080 RepID=A0A8H4RG89_9HELO|nr:hypothetical protein G7Y89_g8639 [Cudoniella acicularis]